MYLLWYNKDIEFFSLVNVENELIPPYAILSHTWGPGNEELRFTDVVKAGGLYRRVADPIGHNFPPRLVQVRGQDLGPSEPDRAIALAKAKPAYSKVLFCASQAREDKLEYCWIDSCCIDQNSSAELSEALNSMFRWYQRAVKCYVFLSDFPAIEYDLSSEGPVSWQTEHKTSFQRSRWFTRGWVRANYTLYSYQKLTLHNTYNYSNLGLVPDS